MRPWLTILTLASGAVLAAQAYGQVFCPRVTSEHNADTTDLLRFRQYAAWKDKTGNDLAVAVYQYLTGYETGIYHIECLRDGCDPFPEYNQNTEPLKVLNVYNGGYCATMHPALEGLWQALGYEQTRSLSTGNPSHCIGEIFYDGAWHLIDFDLRGIVLKPDGVIAGFEDIRKDPGLGTSTKKLEPFFPGTNVPDLCRKYAKTGFDYGYRWNQGSHTADFVLRPGESLTRWWDDSTGRWNHRAEYNSIGWLKDLWKKPPLGMKPNHRDFTRWNHGVGQFGYHPNLAKPSGDFAAGVVGSKGLEPGPDGLVLTAETGEAVFNMFTPFVIAPQVNDLDNLDDDSEAAVVWLNARVPVKLAVSIDNGLTWADAGQIAATPQPATVAAMPRADLTPLVKGRYGYLLKLAVAGKKGDTVIRFMSVDTWVQVAPISLPRLKKGTNHLRYDAGDRYDGATMPVLVLPNVGDPEDLKKHAVEMPAKYDPKKSLTRIQGDVVVKLPAPAGTKIAWLSAGGTFFTYQGKQAASTDNRIACAVGEPKEFKEVYKSLGKNPDWISHWRYNYDTDIRLDSPAEAVYLKYTAKDSGGVNVIRACLHVTPARKQDPAVKITHGYKLAGKLVEKPIEMKAPGDYTIDCDGDVENVFVKIEKPSQ